MRRECYVCGKMTKGIDYSVCDRCKKEQNIDTVAMGLDVYENRGDADEQSGQAIFVVQGL